MRREPHLCRTKTKKRKSKSGASTEVSNAAVDGRGSNASTVGDGVADGSTVCDRIYGGGVSSEETEGGDGKFGIPGVDSSGNSDDRDGHWSRWWTVCKTRHRSENVELPRDQRGANGTMLPSVLGIQYRVAARHRVDGSKRTTFR